LSVAIRTAEEILLNPQNKRRDARNNRDNPSTIHISDALIRSSETRNWTDYTRKLELTNCEYFLNWIDQEGLTHWYELRFEHVQKYQKSLVDRGLAFNTIRLYLLPIRRTAAWMAANWPNDYVNICQNLRLSGRESRKTEYDENEGNPYLPIHGVLDFLDWLARDSKRDRLTVGVSLQGLAGLQLQEALRLTWSKVDLEAESITIDGAVKNQYRIRKIPIPSVVSWILRRARNSIDSTDLLIPDYSSYGTYSRSVINELRRWDSDVIIKAKDLRNTIQTAAIDGGWYGYYVQRYVGHAPTTIGERHYHGDKGKRLIPLFRENVVAHIEAEIAQWNTPVNSPIMPGPRLAINE